MGGKIAPRPSSPLRRSAHQPSALSIARRRRARGAARPQPERAVDPEEKPLETRRPREIAPLPVGRRREQFGDPDSPRIARPRPEREQDHERHERGAGPVGDLAQMEREPARQNTISTGIDGTARHGT